jgi:hypothetical protein
VADVDQKEDKPTEPKLHDLGKVSFNMGIGRKPQPEQKEDKKQ